MNTKQAKKILKEASLANVRNYGAGWTAKIMIENRKVAEVKDYGTGGMVFIQPENGCYDQIESLEAAAQYLALSPLLQTGGSMAVQTLGFACSYTESRRPLIEGVGVMNKELN